MKKNKYVTKKEVDLSKVNVPVLTEEGKEAVSSKAKLVLKVSAGLLALAGVAFVANEVSVAQAKKQKAACDGLVFDHLWEQKEMDKKMDAWIKRNEESGIRRTLWSPSPQMTATFRERQEARKGIAECKGVY